MAKAKTSKKQKPFSIDDLEPVKLKKGVETKKHDPDKKLRDPEFIREALMQCMLDGDTEAFKDIVKAHYEATNTEKALKKVNLSKRTFYQAISEKGNPNLSTVMKMMKGLSA